MRGSMAAVAMLLWSASQEASAGLLDAIRAAESADPSYQLSRFERDVDRARADLASAQLGPQIGAQYSTGYADSGIDSAVGFQDRDYRTESWTVQIRQGVFRPKAWASRTSALRRYQAADMSVKANRQKLANQLAQLWADWTTLHSELRLAQLRLQAAELLVEVAEQSLTAGEGTELERARSGADRASLLRRIADLKTQQAKLELLWQQSTAGYPMPPERVASDLLVLLATDVMSAETYAAPLTTPGIDAARLNVESAEHAVDSVKYNRLPTLDLVASRSMSLQDSEITIGSEFNTYRIQLQASVPLFTNGAIQASVREAQAQLHMAEMELQLERNRQALDRQVAVTTFAAMRSRMEALNTDRARCELALRQAELGVRAGTHTRKDLTLATMENLKAEQEQDALTAEALKLWSDFRLARGELDEPRLAWLAAVTRW